MSKVEDDFKKAIQKENIRINLRDYRPGRPLCDTPIKMSDFLSLTSDIIDENIKDNIDDRLVCQSNKIIFEEERRYIDVESKLNKYKYSMIQTYKKEI